MLLVSTVVRPAASDNITISPPDIYPPDGTFPGDVTVTLVANQPHASVFWTKDGETPTNASRPYTEPIYLFEPGTWKVQAIAVSKVSHLADSVIVSRTYIITPSPRHSARHAAARQVPRLRPDRLSTLEEPKEPTDDDKTKRTVKHMLWM